MTETRKFIPWIWVFIFVTLILAFSTNKKEYWWYLALIGILLIFYGININNSKDQYERNPTSYYDEGGWIKGPPFIGNWGYNTPDSSLNNQTRTEDINEYVSQSSREPLSSELCEECLNGCREKIGAGLEDMKPGAPRDGYCLNRCKLLCGI